MPNGNSRSTSSDMARPARKVKSQGSAGGGGIPDPFTPTRILDAILATALFRCWYIILFFSGWATAVTLLNNRGIANVNVDSTLLSIIGIVLGFAISFRTSSAFERYDEGRKLWSQIILATRTFSRLVWFHVPDPQPKEGQTDEQIAELKAKVLVEKKSILNLLGAFAVAVKHYLRGESGIYYEDLYHFVKFLPAYSLPAGKPERPRPHSQQPTVSTSDSPYPATLTRRSGEKARDNPIRQASLYKKRLTLPVEDEVGLLPGRNPPSHNIMDLFPFSILVPILARHYQSVPGRKAARLRAKLQTMLVSHNLPLELSFYLVGAVSSVHHPRPRAYLGLCKQTSYIAKAQQRNLADAATLSNLTSALNMLVDSLTGLERILTTPIPFSYDAHLWLVTVIYCLLLPIMVYPQLGWMTIPGTAIVTFLFFGFLVLGEEIEDPFGYGRSDLDLDHFTDVIKEELRAMTSTPPPDISDWAFVDENDSLLADHGGYQRIPPSEWVEKGVDGIYEALGSDPTQPKPGRDTPSTFLGQLQVTLTGRSFIGIIMSVPRRGTKGSMSSSQTLGPFAPSDTPRKISSTILFRCFPVIMIFSGWAAIISGLNHVGYEIHVQNSLITLMGTVLGFVISYTTSSSFDKYNQGRKNWSRIIFAIRNFARITWFHIPDQKPGEPPASDEIKAKSLVEKKTIINLLGAFAVATKHYLRGEDDCICYEDMYYHVRFLPTYADIAEIPKHPHTHPVANDADLSFAASIRRRAGYKKIPLTKGVLEKDLRPATNPPGFRFLNLVPFCFLNPILTHWPGHSRKERCVGAHVVDGPRNIPLELSLYLSSYIETVQQRGVCDAGTLGRLAGALDTLLDCYASLECILSSPVHFSFAAHLWSVTTIFCFLLPIMIWPQFGWVTIPATAIFTFLFFGFLVAGKELEDPFGYDKNDLNLDYITNTIIRSELKSMTATSLPFPGVATWAFAEENDHLLSDHGVQHISPSDLAKQGTRRIFETLGGHTHPLVVSGVETQSPTLVEAKPGSRISPMPTAKGLKEEMVKNQPKRADSGHFSD
ncbi:hypothetical protein NP233_g5846 [Leucocoprinus birnbaumii]|uniref:Uncharacterized protein n=1 Tax=Leucocoprinus birnbaumii TaxID=56174 RepID=A0AAD5YU79_9AGAR|nr:hypothetical protein NP233_g5846 [Leucocoprinus birnbaumii]